MTENNLTENKFMTSQLNFESIIQPLIPYLEYGICTKLIHKKISTCKFSF